MKDKDTIKVSKKDWHELMRTEKELCWAPNYGAFSFALMQQQMLIAKLLKPPHKLK